MLLLLHVIDEQIPTPHASRALTLTTSPTAASRLSFLPAGAASMQWMVLLA
jgi:hypothetical protein